MRHAASTSDADQRSMASMKGSRLAEPALMLNRPLPVVGAARRGASEEELKERAGIAGPRVEDRLANFRLANLV